MAQRLSHARLDARRDERQSSTSNAVARIAGTALRLSIIVMVPIWAYPAVAFKVLVHDIRAGREDLTAR